jgi:hypothetical protein
VVLPGALREDGFLLSLLEERACGRIFATPAEARVEAHRAVNLGLALAVLERLGLPADRALEAMLAMPGDRFDFRVIDCGGTELALAFSVNDIASSRALFESLNWRKQDTRVLYNHRADRPARLKSFLGWLNDSAWQDATIIGDRPLIRSGAARFVRVRSKANLLGLFRPGERVFGCGNIAGVPLALATD